MSKLLERVKIKYAVVPPEKDKVVLVRYIIRWSFMREVFERGRREKEVLFEGCKDIDPKTMVEAAISERTYETR